MMSIIKQLIWTAVVLTLGVNVLTTPVTQSERRHPVRSSLLHCDDLLASTRNDKARNIHNGDCYIIPDKSDGRSLTASSGCGLTKRGCMGLRPRNLLSYGTLGYLPGWCH